MEGGWMPEREMKNRPLIDRAFGPGASTMTANDAPDVGQSYSGSLELIFAVQPLEKPEEPPGIVHIEPGSVVPNLKFELGGVFPVTDLDPRGLAALGIFDRIIEKVSPDLFQHRPVGVNGRQ